MSENRDSRRRVAITGIGVVSPIGMGVDEVWDSLSSGRSGISPAEILLHTAAPGNMAGEVKAFNDATAKSQYLKKQRKSIKVMCREIQLGVASASLALEGAGLEPDQVDHERMGVEFGANLMFSPPEVLKDACFSCVEGDNHFVYQRWGSQGLSNLEPLWLLRYLPNMPACHIGIYADARGPNNSLTLDEASGNLAVAQASAVIARGDADVMIAGATGTRLHPVKSLHAFLWDELSRENADGAPRCRPFDLNRTGQIVGEGACSFILEEESHARARGAKIFGTVLGGGSSCTIDPKGKPLPRQAMVNAIRAALQHAGIEPEDIGHINANGLATRLADIDEAQAIRTVLGSHADTVPVFAFKSYVGNAGSSCGTLELAASLIGLDHGVVPPTLNYETPDPECGLNVVAGKPLPTKNRIFLKTSVTRMAQASALIVAGAE